MRFSYALTDLGNTVVRLGSMSGLTMRAYKGEVASCEISLDDPAGSIDIEPFRSFVVDEMACSATRIGKWYVVQRTYERTDSYRTGPARRIKVALYDLNATLSMKLITHSTFHYLRPAETDVERINWLLAHVLDTIPIVDSGLYDTADPVDLSAVDYTGQFPLQVLTDCANRSNKNFFIYADETTGASSLAYFKASDLSTYVSTLNFSNVRADLNSTTFAPLMDASGEADPSLVYDGVYMPYGTKGDSVYVRAAGRFLARDVVGPSANTSSRTRATELAQKMLDNHDSEQSTVHFTAKIPASQVNLIKEGMLTTARFTHIPGWETGKDVRVLNRAVKQDEENDQVYNVELAVGIPVLVNFQPGNDPANEHEPLPPFVPGTGGTPTYIQSQKLQNVSGTGPETITLGAAPTAGNFLGLYLGQPQSPGANTYILPDGWTQDEVFNATAPAPNSQMVIASKISDGTETSVTVDWTGTGQVEIFYFEYSGAGSWGGFSTGQGGPGSTFVLPSVTPTPNQATAVLAFLNWDPDYTVVSPLANTRQFQTRSGWAARCAMSYSDTIIASASGSYDGTTSGSVGSETNYAAIVGWLQGSAGDAPSIGQTVAPESATADGAQVIYQTNYPYIPGSLVVKVNGNVVVVDETDPTTGTFTLPAPPASGAIITWTYNVADPAPTGANNPAATPSGPAVPPSDGTVLGGDGVYRQPSQAFVPAETPDGAITVFTIPPYIAGSTLVYINGLIQRITTDYAETSPGTGVITFTTAPWTGAEIIVVAMPSSASPSPTGARSVTWGPPVTTATVVIPGTIDPTGATDVAAAINAWVESVPDGRILDFNGGTFKLSQGIQLSNRHNLVLWGNGATLNVAAGASGGSQLTSPIVVGHKYGGSWTLGSTDIAIHDFTIVGNNPTPGTFVPGSEAQANLELTGCTRLEVYDIAGSNAYGDFAFFEDITDGWLHDCTSTGSGRDGVSVISGNRILVETTTLDDVGQNVFDIEPNTSAQACLGITLRNCTATVWDNAFLGIEGTHTGAPVHNIIVSGNVISTDSLLSIVDNGNTSRMTNISIINNVSLGGSVAGPVITVKYTDNVTVTGNVQTHSGALTSFTSCTNVVT